MGTRGPKPTPTALKAITGGRRAAVDLGEGINPPVKAPTKPKHLIGAAAGEWRRIVPHLIDLGLLTELDRAALANYCQAWGEIVLVKQRINDEIKAAIAAGKPADTALWRTLPSGIARPSILQVLLERAEVRCDRALAHFGLSPATRARVTASREVGGQPQLPGIEDPVNARLQRLAVVK